MAEMHAVRTFARVGDTGSHRRAAPPLPAWLALPDRDGGDEEDGRAPRRTRYRTIFVSDVHLGTSGSNAAMLLDFLKAHECETLYLVGDIVDGWQLRKGWYWPQAHNDVVRAILKMAKHGTRVIYIPGNHDEHFRDYTGLEFGGIELLDEDVHVTADGRRLLVIHGDQFDNVVLYHKWLAFLGDGAYTLLLKSNGLVNWCRRRLGLPYWSLAAHMKKRVKNAVAFISRFEEVVAHAAAERRWRAWCAATSIRPRSASSARSPIITMATGWRAAPRWSNMAMAGWRSSTGPNATGNRNSPRANARARRWSRPDGTPALRETGFPPLIRLHPETEQPPQSIQNILQLTPTPVGADGHRDGTPALATIPHRSGRKRGVSKPPLPHPPPRLRDQPGGTGCLHARACR